MESVLEEFGDLTEGGAMEGNNGIEGVGPRGDEDAAVFLQVTLPVPVRQTLVSTARVSSVSRIAASKIKCKL